jgi:rare lipoprotein A
MNSLIPGLTATLAYLQPQQAASPPPQEGFSQLLNGASQSLSSGEAPASPSPPRYTVQAGDTLTAIAKKLGVENPQVLARANRLKDPDRLQIGQVLTLPENPPALDAPVATRLANSSTRPSVDRSQTGAAVKSAKGRQVVTASWYGSQHHGKLMANGKPYNMFADTVAHKNLPLGTPLTLINPKTGTSVKVQVTDRGPYVAGRNLDLSFGAARKLGVVKSGVAKLWMEEG